MDYGLHDGMDEALQEARTEAARYKAERDIARQELDRLREAGGGADGDATDEQRMPQEDEEAARWVREQGGLESVMARCAPQRVIWPRYEDGNPVTPGEDGVISLMFGFDYESSLEGDTACWCTAMDRKLNDEMRLMGERFDRPEEWSPRYPGLRKDER